MDAGGVSVLEARIKAALADAGHKRRKGDLHGARELALSILAIDDEHREARVLLAELLLELERPSARPAPMSPAPAVEAPNPPETPAPTVEVPRPPEAVAAPEEAPAVPDEPAWPSLVAPPEVPTLPAEPRPRVVGRTVSRKLPGSVRSGRPARTRVVAIVGGVGAAAVGAALLASATFLRSDSEVALRASPSPPAPAPTAVPAVAHAPEAPRARPVDPEVLRRAEALLARGDYAEAQRAVNDGLALDPTHPGLRALQRRVQADAQRAANEAAARVGEARSGAERARAAELAPRLFQQARDMEAEAARAYQRQLWAEALARSVEAARAYKEAQGQAETARLEYERTRAAAAEAAALEQSRRAALDAAAAPRPATPAAAANPSDVDRAAIVALIKSYAAAMEAKDLGALKKLWPGLGGAQETKVRSGFEFAKSLRLQVEVTGVQITGGAATVTCRRRDTVVTMEGQTVQSDRTAVIRLVKNTHGWSIAAIQ